MPMGYVPDLTRIVTIPKSCFTLCLTAPMPVKSMKNENTDVLDSGKTRKDSFTLIQKGETFRAKNALSESPWMAMNVTWSLRPEPIAKEVTSLRNMA